MTTLVMTVPRSGTHFLLRFLVGVLGLDVRSGDVTEESNVDFLHIHPSIAAFKECTPSDFCDTCIITLRHPHETVLTDKWKGANVESAAASWGALIAEQGKYKKTLFLVIDGPESDRFPQLMAIAKHFGKTHLEGRIRKYADEWTPANPSLTEDDVNAIQFAARVYEQWRP